MINFGKSGGSGSDWKIGASTSLITGISKSNYALRHYTERHRQERIIVYRSFYMQSSISLEKHRPLDGFVKLECSLFYTDFKANL